MNPQDDSNDAVSGRRDHNAHDPTAPQVVADNDLARQTEPMIGSMDPPPGGPFLLTNTLNAAEAELDPTRNAAWWMQESDPFGLLGGLDPTQVQQAARTVAQYQYGLGNLNDFRSIFATGQQSEAVQNPQPTGTSQAKPIPTSDSQLLADITAHLENGRYEFQPAGNMPPLATWNTNVLSTSTRPRTHHPQQLQQPKNREVSPQTTITDPRYSSEQLPGAAKRPMDDSSESTPRKKPTVVSKATNEYGTTAELPINIDSSSSPAGGNAPGLEFADIPALPLNQPLGQLDQGPQPQSHPPDTDVLQFIGNDEATMPPPANNQPRSVATPKSRRGTPRARTAGPTTPKGTSATPVTRTSEGGTPKRVATTPNSRSSELATPKGAATPAAQSPRPSTPRNIATPRRRAAGSRTPKEAATPRERTPRQSTPREGTSTAGSPRARTARTGTPTMPSQAPEQASPPQPIIDEPTDTEDLNVATVQQPESGIRALPSHTDAQGLLGAPIQAPFPAGGGCRPLLPATPSGRHSLSQLGLGGLDASARQCYASHPGHDQAMTPAEYHAAVAASTNVIGRGGVPTIIDPRPNAGPIGELNNPRAHIAHIQDMRRTTMPGQVNHRTHPMQNLVAPSQAHGPGMLSQETAEYFEQVRARLEAQLEAAQSGRTQSDDYEQEQARAARAIPENLLRYSRQHAAMASARRNVGQALNSRPAPQQTGFQESLAPVHIPGIPRPPSGMILPSQAQSPLASHSPYAPVQGGQGQGYKCLQKPPNMFPNLYQQALGLLGPTANVQGGPNAQDNISATQNNGATTHGGVTTLASNHPVLRMPMQIRGHEEMGRYTHRGPGDEVPVQGGLSTGTATQTFMPNVQGAQTQFSQAHGNFQFTGNTDFSPLQMPNVQGARVQNNRNFQATGNKASSPLRMPDIQGPQAQGQDNFQAFPQNTDFAPPQMQMPRDSISAASAISQMSDPSLAWSGSSLAAQSQSQSQAPTPAFTSLENFYGDVAVGQEQQQHFQMLDMGMGMGLALAQQNHGQSLGLASEPMPQNQFENMNQMLGQGTESGLAPAAVKNTADLGLVGAGGEAVGPGASAGAGVGDNLGVWDLDGDGSGQPAESFEEFMNNLLGMGK